MTPQRPKKIDNGLKRYIERFPGVRSRYVSGTIRQLLEMPGAKVYADSQIKRVVNDQVELNLDNMVIKEAFLKVLFKLHPEAEFIDWEAEAKIEPQLVEA